MDGKQLMLTESEKTTATRCCSGSKKEKMPGPDGGMAWVVAFACCTINFIMAGLGRMSGILFVAFIEVYGVDRKSASMPFSVKSSAGNLFGPVVGILGQKYGARKIIVIGGIIGTLSSAACFFAPDVMWITVLWGGVNGLGSALTVTLPQVVIGQYFEKHRTTAAGIAFSGGCFGSFVFPMLLEYLLDNFGIEGTFLIIGAIIMHTIPAALILKKPSWLKRKIPTEVTCELSQSSEKAPMLEALNSKGEDSISNGLTQNNGSLVQTSTSIFSVNECTPRTPSSCRPLGCYPNLNLLKKNCDLDGRIITFIEMDKNVSSILKDSNQNEIDIIGELNSLDKIQRHAEKCQKNEDVQNEIFTEIQNLTVNLEIEDGKTSSGRELPRVHSKSKISVTSKEQRELLQQLTDLANLKENVTTSFPKATNVSLVMTELGKFCLPEKIPKYETKEVIESPKESEINIKQSASLLDHIKTAFKLYSNPLFIMVCLCRAVHFIAFIPAMTTVVDFSMDKGLLEDEAKFAIAAISMGDLLGRLCFGWVTDRGFMTLPKYMMTIMIAQGISTASLPMMNTQITIFSNLALFGLLQGSLFVRHPVLISKYMKSNEQSIAMGCVNFISGIIGFGLPIYIGYFRDTMGSYDCIFYLNGLLGACVGLLWIFEPFFVRCANKLRNQKLSTV